MSTLGNVERVMTSVRQLQELRPAIETRMQEAHGPNWAAMRRGRGRATSPKGPHDSRFLLACIAHEDALATIFSPADRADARRLIAIANNAWHDHLTRLGPDDVAFAADTTARLLAAGRAATPPPLPSPSPPTSDVGLALKRAMQRTEEDARQERRQLEQQRAEAAHRAQLQQAHAERVWWLERSISTFVALASARADLGAQRIPETRWGVRGWIVAASTERTCYLTTKGQLRFRGTDGDGTWQAVPMRLDPTGRHQTILLPTSSAPFADAWDGARDDGRRLSSYGSLDLDEAIVETLGELCIAHGLEWPDQETDADAELRAMLADLPRRQALAEQVEEAALRRVRRVKQARLVAPWTVAPFVAGGVGLLLTSSEIGACAGIGAWWGWFSDGSAEGIVFGCVTGLAIGGVLAVIL